MNTLPDTKAVTATLGLGGNIDDPVHAMACALQALDDRADCRVTGVSRLYRTPPWGKTDQAFFYNSCASLETTLPAPQLLALCLDIERNLKRVRIERWGPRTIDIDILTYGDETIDRPDLHVPHPRMTERGFVLMPLADIARNMLVGGRSVERWLSDADVHGIELADASGDWWRRA